MGLWEDAQGQAAANSGKPAPESETERYLRVHQEQTGMIAEFLGGIARLNIAPSKHKFVIFDPQKMRYVPRWFHSVNGWMIGNNVVLTPDGNIYELADPNRRPADLRLEQAFSVNIDEIENLQTSLKNTLARYMQNGSQ